MFCLVSGGPYGLEPVIGNAGIQLGLILIVLMPLIWAVPTALMTAELSAAIPEEGGYYVWVKRALGPFAGFQCAWLSWLYSIVDSALYPLLFAEYLSRNLASLLHWELGGARWFVTGIAILHIIIVTGINILGITSVGRAAVILTFLIIAPFAVVLLKSGLHPTLKVSGESASFAVGLATVMWNYLGWDNLSTVAGEIEKPQQTIPKALFIAVPMVMLVYLLPVLATINSSPRLDQWQDGSWPEIAARAAGPVAGGLVLFGGLASATAMFVSQMLASSRIPAVFATEGFFPKGLAHISPRTGTPVRSIILCAILYSCFSWFSFKELITVNAILYGMSVLLELAALIVLRKREPELPRPFKIPGGLPVLAILTVCPIALVGLLAVSNIHDEGWGKQIPTAIAILSGTVVFGLRMRLKMRSGNQ
jgi:amino acid transporter